MEANNDEGIQSPDMAKNKTLDAIKSQKNLTGPYGHEEEQKQVEEQRRGGRGEKTEMRQTWKRPRVPHHKKLQTFIQYSNKPVAKSQAKDGRELMQKLTMMEENNQYKYAQQLLSPLKLEEKKKKETEEARAMQEKKQSMNPFIPVKKHIKLAKEINDRLDRDMQDLSIERVRAFKTHMAPPSIKLEQFVTVEIIKRSQNTGAVKKMLHVPTMKLYVIKEEPIANKESRNTIIEWISQWQNKIYQGGVEHFSYNPFVKVQTIFWYPEGFASILCQYCQGGSLQDLLDSVGTLPQNVIKEVCTPLLVTLQAFYANADVAFFGGLSTSQLLFTEYGNVKLNMGLFYKITSIASSNIFSTRGTFNKPKQNLEIFSSLQTNANKLWAKWANHDRSQPNNEQDRSFDVFKIGLIMFLCSIGSFQIYEQSSILFENLKMMLSQQGQKTIQKQNVCCILHSEEYILNFSQERRVDTSKIFKYTTFLKNRYSGHFLSFLCQCLKLSNKKRAKLTQLLTHPFITVPSEPKNTKVQLVDLLKISRGWCEETPSIQLLDKKIEKLCESIAIVLSNCRRDYLYDLKHQDKEKISRLAKEMGVRDEVLFRRYGGLLKQLETRLVH